MSGCLGDETIAAMLEGGLAELAAQQARAHITQCDTCRRLVSAAIDADPWTGATVPAMPQAPPTTLASGSVIASRYRLDQPLGVGGMGRVFAARQLGLERAVAIKILRPELAHDAMALRRFAREARLVASLRSEQVVRVHDYGELPGGQPYLVMELLEGEDLARIAARGPIAPAAACAWIVAACAALGEAHALGIIHRDIKPSNLFVTRTGQLKILDFGLAKLAVSQPGSRTGSITADGMVLGSPHYMAPEQITGARDVDHRADLWSLGATLYHLIAGVPPFAEPTLEAVFGRILSGPPAQLDRLPPDVARVVQRALSRDPAARFATAGELATALAPRARRISRRAIGAAAAAIAAIAIVAWRPWSSEPVAPSAAPVVAPVVVPAVAPTPAPAPEPHAPRATIATPPAGWKLAAPALLRGLGVGPETTVLVPEHAVPRSTRASPVIVIEDLELDAGERLELVHADAAYCQVQATQLLVTTPGELKSAKPAALAPLHGCDIEIRMTDGRAMRSLVLSDGDVAFVVGCSRDQAGDPAVDAACVAIAPAVHVE